MSTPPFIAHGSFSIDRRYPPAAVERVYAAWVDPARKARWFVGPDGWTELERTLDVHEGAGPRLNRAGWPLVTPSALSRSVVQNLS